ncbi:GNAT family N-acetyltransferase [Vibrio salinus]|uniref:GNAT family N-acetyltransferase n=1 Tax=Vibrio salinus TaxID=2899784 RepID=UPI001E5D59CA|nr:GNAT family N-acetyltransferase [Vibrio salinus]MCE0493131.1 N-acetyltransferase family protein [Vibrio salinus]
MLIRKINDSDIDTIVKIYNHYIENTVFTFEEDPITSDIISKRVKKLEKADLPWLVVESEGEVKGYAYASPWHTRSAYRYTVEPTIYLSPDTHGKGLGRSLYTTLIELLKEQGIKNIISVITKPNPASVKLHESLGFRQVGEFSNIGFKFNRDISVGYWQLALQN